MNSLPTPRTPDPMLAPSLRWGVMGTGWIAEKFTAAVQQHTTQRFTAVASRDLDRARAAARRFGIPRGVGSYAELAADPEVDVVYVATGHGEHLDCALTAIAAGKHVLVEKPLALDEAQARRITEAAAAAGVFCAEALWSAYLPRFDVVRQILDSGVLGEIRTVLADLGEHFDPGHRILRADAHGGPLYDLGTYPLFLATWVLGEPTALQAVPSPHPSGILGQVAAVLTHDGERQSVLHTSLLSTTPTTAGISGTRGSLFLPGPFYHPGRILLALDGEEPQEFAEPEIGHAGLFFEAAEAARCIDAGRTETPLRPLVDSLTTLRTLDRLRRHLAADSAVDPRAGSDGQPM